MSNGELKYGDGVCVVLAPNRAKETIYSVLDEFIPGHVKLDGDYSFSTNENLTFPSEYEILKHLEENKNLEGTLYWKGPGMDPMVGAHFTSDGQLIMSLTVRANGVIENEDFNQLRITLDSDVGTIFYNEFQAFDNGEDFKTKYGLQK